MYGARIANVRGASDVLLTVRESVFVGTSAFAKHISLSQSLRLLNPWTTFYRKKRLLACGMEALSAASVALRSTGNLSLSLTPPPHSVDVWLAA